MDLKCLKWILSSSGKIHLNIENNIPGALHSTVCDALELAILKMPLSANFNCVSKKRPGGEYALVTPVRFRSEQLPPELASPQPLGANEV